MAIGTYAELQAAIADWMIREDLTDQIPTFIAMAESRFNRVLRVPEMETDVTATVDSAIVTLPSDFLQMRAVYVDGDIDYPLEQASLHELRATYGDSTGEPRSFALQNDVELILGPEPGEDTVLVLNYYQKIPALSDSATTNWLLTEHPDLYLAAALVEGYAFTRDSEGMGIWTQRTREMIDQLERQGVRKGHTAGPLQARPHKAGGLVSRIFSTR